MDFEYSIVIPTCKSANLLPCLESIEKYTDLSRVEIIVVANGYDAIAPVTAPGTNFKLIWHEEMIGYPRAVNEGIEASSAPFVVLLNDDTILLEQPRNQWLDMLRAPFADSKVGITGPWMSVQADIGREFLIFFCAMMRKALFSEIGLLDADAFGAGYGDDVDFCLRAEIAGYKLVQVPTQNKLPYDGREAKGEFPIWHAGNKTFVNWPGGEELLAKNHAILRERYGLNIEKAQAISGATSPSELQWLASQAMKAGTIIELGSWFGRSTRALADNTKGKLYAIDTWQGSVNEPAMVHCAAQLDGDLAYNEFLRNMGNSIGHKVIHFRALGREGAALLSSQNVKADLVFVDAEHTEHALLEDIINYAPLASKRMAFHDYRQPLWPDVTRVLDKLFGNSLQHVPGTTIAFVDDPSAHLKNVGLVGKRFGQLVVIERVGVTTRRQYLWRCRCDCGVEKTLHTGRLSRGRTKSCGCLRVVKARAHCKKTFSLPAGKASLNRAWASYRQGAQRRNIPWEVSREEFDNLIVQPCYYCGAEPSNITKYNKCQNGTIARNGIDRLNPAGGYTKGNVVPCCKSCNYAKREETCNTFLEKVRTIYIRHGRPSRIFDAFSFFNECELLEVRLTELDPVVDRFVIVEATQTHQGAPKPLYFKDNIAQFEKWLHKISHVVVDFPPDLAPIVQFGPNPHLPEAHAWAREQHQRNAIMRALDAEARPNDTCIISDADEISRPSAIREYRTDMGLRALEMGLYRYYLNNLGASPWREARILPFRVLKQLTPCGARYSQLVTGEIPIGIPNAGHHFSYQGGVARIETKLNSFAHTNLAGVGKEHILKAVENNSDLYGREEEPEFHFVEVDATFPTFILENQAKFQAMGWIK